MPSTCLFNQKEGRDGETGGRKRWPCLLPIRPIMSDEERAMGRADEEREEGQHTEVRAMEGWRKALVRA